MRIKQDTSKTSIIPFNLKRAPFVVSINIYDVQATPVLTTEVVEQDAVFNLTTSADYHKEGRVRVFNALDPQLENKTPTVCTLSEDGVLTRLSEGVAEIWVSYAGVIKIVRLDMRNMGTEVTQVFNRVVTPSLMSHCIEQIDTRLAGMVKATNIGLYSSQNHSTDTYIRNPNCWVTRSDGFTPVDVTSISPSNSRDNHRRAGTLITPRHVLNATHYPLYNNDKIYFVTQDGNNTVIERTIIGSVNHPNYSPYHPDLRLYTLDSDVPASISPCKTIPSDYADYIVQTQLGQPPTLGLDQEEKGLVTNLYGISTTVSHSIPTDAQRLAFYEQKIGGDSGNPSFLIINNELVLLTCWTYGGAGGGTSVPYYQSDINIMIQTADAQAGISPTGYTIGTVDLSGFPTFA